MAASGSSVTLLDLALTSAQQSAQLFDMTANILIESVDSLAQLALGGRLGRVEGVEGLRRDLPLGVRPPIADGTIEIGEDSVCIGLGA